MHNWVSKSIITVAMVMACISANAMYTATAYFDNGKGNLGGWASAETLVEARRLAVQQCNNSSKKQDCSIGEEIKGVVFAKGETRIGYALKMKSIPNAEKAAMASCEEKSCKIIWSVAEPGFFALMSAVKGDEYADYIVQSGGTNLDNVITAGKSSCEQQHPGATCKVVFYGSIGGKVKTASNSNAAAIPRSPQSQSCRPTTDVVRCSAKCINGNCTITYENGCKMKVNVQPSFNGSTWVYPPPAC